MDICGDRLHITETAKLPGYSKSPQNYSKYLCSFFFPSQSLTHVKIKVRLQQNQTHIYVLHD